MNKKLVWGVAIIIILITGVLYLYPRVKVAHDIQTSGWKTYTNERYGFGIKYPDDWIAEAGISGTIVRFRPVDQVQKPDRDTVIDQVFIRQEKGCSADNWHTGFADSNYKHECFQSADLGIDMTAISPDAQEIEENILSTFTFIQSNSFMGNTPHVFKPEWGISFVVPREWKITNDVDSQVVLMHTSSQDRITLDYTRSQSYTDIDTKFGNVTYEYNDVAQKWYQVTDTESGSGQKMSEAKPAFYLYNVIPVFLGTSRWKTYIITISDDQFIKVNITGSGNTQPLEEFVKSIEISS